MSITGKLFGALGNAAPAAPVQASETTRPGYSSWYSRQMAKSYELRRVADCGLLLAA